MSDLKRCAKLCRRCEYYVKRNFIGKTMMMCDVAWWTAVLGKASAFTVTSKEFRVPEQCPYRLEMIMMRDGR